MKYCHVKKNDMRHLIGLTVFPTHGKSNTHHLIGCWVLRPACELNIFCQMIFLVKVGPSLPSPITITSTTNFFSLFWSRHKQTWESYQVEINLCLDFTLILICTMSLQLLRKDINYFLTKYIIAHVLHSNIKYFILYSRGLWLVPARELKCLRSQNQGCVKCHNSSCTNLPRLSYCKCYTPYWRVWARRCMTFQNKRLTYQLLHPFIQNKNKLFILDWLTNKHKQHTDTVS